MRPSTPQELLRSADLSAFLVSNLTHIRYLTGLSLSAGFLLVLPRRFLLFTDGRYAEVAQQQTREGVLVRDFARLESFLQKVPECGFESETVTVAKLRKWKRCFKNTKFVQVRGVIEEFRRSKEPDELRAFRRAQRMTRELLRRVPSALRTSITEKKLAWQLRVWAHELSAEELSFDPIVAFGTHTSRPHHEPTDRKLKKGHIVQIDVGARYHGYCADQSAVFFTGKPTALQQRVYEAVSEAKRKAISAVKAGVTNRMLDRIATKVLEKEGLDEYFVHALGHGVGLEIHEGVTLSERAPKKALLLNEIVTIEPGVYIPGKFGIRLEEEVVVHE